MQALGPVCVVHSAHLVFAALTTYKQAFRFIEHHIRPEIIFADFENAIHLAVSEVWPQSKLRRCRFHLGQAWWRKIQSLGLSDEFKNKDSEIGQILK
jgi:hypothetical protein